MDTSIRWCERRSWLRGETLPYLALVRSFGAAVALAMVASTDEPTPSGGTAARERSADGALSGSQQVGGCSGEGGAAALTTVTLLFFYRLSGPCAGCSSGLLGPSCSG